MEICVQGRHEKLLLVTTFENVTQSCHFGHPTAPIVSVLLQMLHGWLHWNFKGGAHFEDTSQTNFSDCSTSGLWCVFMSS